MSDDESSSVEGLLLCAKVGDIATFKKLLREGDDVLQKDKVNILVYGLVCVFVLIGLNFHTLSCH